MANKFKVPNLTFIGANALEDAEEEICKLGKRAFVVIGRSMIRQGHLEKLQAILERNGIVVSTFCDIVTEPSDVDVSKGAALYQQSHSDFIIGFGGGSQLDAAKAIAVVVTSKDKISSYVGKNIDAKLPPIVAIPSTAGTGSETTQFTIITDTKTQVKMLIKGDSLMPSIAIVDPLFSLQTPRNVTVSTGLDALTHAIEAFTSRKAFAQSDLFARSAIKRIFNYLPEVIEDGSNILVREQMAFAAYEAGVSFSNSSVTIVHGMSRPIGALFHVPHGLSNAMLLKDCLAYVVDGAYPKFAELAQAIKIKDEMESEKQAALKFIAAVDQLCNLCKVPSLSEYGIDKVAYFNAITKMAKDAIASGSPANTQKVVDEADLVSIYTHLWK